VRLSQDYTGRSTYKADHEDGANRLLVAVTCRIGDLPYFTDALLDTAAEWCVLRADVLGDLDYPDEPGEVTTMLTRFGALSGILRRISVSFIADEGDAVPVEATWFVAPDWPGPAVIGWKGCLERMRFALDPSDQSFYFAEL